MVTENSIEEVYQSRCVFTIYFSEGAMGRATTPDGREEEYVQEQNNRCRDPE